MAPSIKVTTGRFKVTRLLQESKPLTAFSDNCNLMTSCPICENTFDSELGMKIHKGKVHGVEETECTVCGKTIKRSPCRIDNNNVCSNECLYEYQRNRVSTECENCAAELTVKESVFERNEYLFCDRDWYNKAWSGEITPHYGEESPWLPTLSGEEHPMYGVRGEEAPGWKEDSIDQNWRKSHKWDRTQNDVLNRDDNKCQDCGSDESLHVHHIEPVSDGGAKFDTENLITLCREHHYRRHSK